ncbi:hypothetical protein PCARR_a1777 [Pseudoalteromonas carrageenovora IAM 12662]|uniref:Uncharacterized protein n=1 Tax=Pseudoalteromonas carrageenovora IAM 12662 TaxID=1314868 RepID=A0ABR9ESC8_PSEVC|nr:hypothetical protein [Pseudoalteromonas carrageenovora IAM 12662]
MVADGGISQLELELNGRRHGLPFYNSVAELAVVSLDDSDDQVLINRLVIIADEGVMIHGLNFDIEVPSVIYLDDSGKYYKISDSFEGYLNMLRMEIPEIPEETNKAIAQNDLAEIQRLIDKNGIGWRDRYGFSFSELAGAMGALDSLKFLIDKGISLNGVKELAVQNKRLNIIEYLDEITKNKNI